MCSQNSTGRRLVCDEGGVCVYLQVKRVMNGVFHSLRAEFDLAESYSGQAVLGLIVTTIKVSVFYTRGHQSKY